MKRILLLVLSVMALVSSLVLVTTAVASASQGPLTWQLDSETTAAGYQMERTGAPGDDGQAGNVPIGSGGSLTWISDEAAGADVTFSGGAWVLELATEKDWGILGSNCHFDAGESDGTGFNAFSTILLVSASWKSGNEYIVQVKVQTGSETVHKGNYLAVQITNNDTAGHTIYTGEGANASCLRSPQTTPGFPLPEVAAGILLGGGLLGLGGYIAIRRKRTGTANS